MSWSTASNSLPSAADSESISTYYVALPFLRSEHGELVAGKAKQAPSASSARLMAFETVMSGLGEGAIAVALTGNAVAKEFEPAQIIAKFGETYETLCCAEADG
jgi:hypothetical protein